jgi:Short C-terminal domain
MLNGSCRVQSRGFSNVKPAEAASVDAPEPGAVTCDGVTVYLGVRVLGRNMTRHLQLAKLRDIKVYRAGGALTVGMKAGVGWSVTYTVPDRTIRDVTEMIRPIFAHRPNILVVTDSRVLAAELPTALPGIGVRHELRPRQVQVKKYKSEREFQRDAELRIRQGWHIEGQSSRTKHWSMATGFLTNKGQTTVTWLRGGDTEDEPEVMSGATVPVASIPDQIGQLAQLRDQGVLTDDEFQAKKTELLGKM